jgi:hypothetical protein
MLFFCSNPNRQKKSKKSGLLRSTKSFGITPFRRRSADYSAFLLVPATKAPLRHYFLFSGFSLSEQFFSDQ